MVLVLRKVIRILLRDIIKWTSKHRTMVQIMVYRQIKKVEHRKRKMSYKYNKVRHLELLRRFLDFKKQGKDLDTENRDECLELSRYQSKIQNYIFWKSREQFALLMENFVNDSIEMEEFENAFSRLWWKSMKEDDTFAIDLERVKNFQHNPRSDRFCSFVIAVFLQFEELEDEYCTEQEVKDYVRDILQKIQPYL